MSHIIEDTFVMIDPEFHFVRRPIHSVHDSNFKLMGVEKDFQHVAQKLKDHPPEFIVTRVSDGEEDSFQKTVSMIKQIKQTASSKIVLMNVKEEKSILERFIDLEVNGIINENNCSIEEALRQVKDYNLYLSTSYQKILCEEMRKISPAPPKHYDLVIDRETALNYLTASETDILYEMLMVGGSNEEISKRLFLAPKTVKNYVSSMMIKLDANNRTHLIPRSIKKGIIQLK